jgi:plastocyanin
MRRLILSLAFMLVLGGGIAFADEYGQPMSPPTPAASAAPSPAASPVSSIPNIHIRNFAFVPDTVTIKPGGTVRWIQDDDTPHTVTAADKSFDSGNLDKKAVYTHTFDKAGTYAYVCAYHPSMRAKVIVAP